MTLFNVDLNTWEYRGGQCPLNFPELCAVEYVMISDGHGIQLRLSDVPFEGIKAEGKRPVADRRDSVDVKVNLLQSFLRTVIPTPPNPLHRDTTMNIDPRRKSAAVAASHGFQLALIFSLKAYGGSRRMSTQGSRVHLSLMGRRLGARS